MANEVTPIVLTKAEGLSYTVNKLSTDQMARIDRSTPGYIDLDDTSQNNDPSKMLLIFGNASTGSTGGRIKFLTSTLSPFTGSGQTDVSVTLDASTDVHYGSTTVTTAAGRLTIVPVPESAQYKDTDGYLNFEVDTASTPGNVITVRAIVLP